MNNKSEDQKEIRSLQVKFDRSRLHSSIMGAMRRRRLNLGLRGADIIRGTVFGLVDHPEYSIEQAIQRAVEMTKLPGEIEDGYEESFECIETRLREKDSYDKGGQRISEKEIVDRAISGLLYDVRKDFCYDQTMKYLKNKGYCLDSFAGELIKNMLFKKIFADDSTKECMYDYAYRKTYQENVSQNVEKEVDELIESIIPEGKSVYDFIMQCADEIYELNKTDEITE